MEAYTTMDVKDFDRIEYFQYFMRTGTTIELTVKIDVTAAVGKCKNESIHFQSYILFKLYEVVNTIKNFRYDIVNGKLVEWKSVVPTFSSFNNSTKLFSTLYADMADNYAEFDIRYKEAIAKYANAHAIVPQGNLPQNVFNVSCIPWLHFEHFSSNASIQEHQIVKMITLGKYKESGGRLICPFTLQVSHAIADGYHASLFFEKLQAALDAACIQQSSV
nr:CatA-like O-acetyltransferase [Maliibacterium massiliense]